MARTLEAPTSPTAPVHSGTTDPSPAARTGRGGVTFTGVLHSEWIKLRSVRSTFTTYAAAVGLLLFFGTLAAAFTGGTLASPDGDGGPPAGDPTATVLGGSLLVALVMGTLGVISMTSEYANGTVRSTMAFVPRRVPVLLAKALVLVAMTLPVMLVASFGTFLVGQAVLAAGDPGTATAALGDPGVLRAVIGTAVYLTGVTVMGLAVGALLRTTPAALSVLFALLFLVPGLGQVLLPASIGDDVLPYLPSNAANAFTSVAPSPDVLGTAAGSAVFAAWLVAPLLVAAVALVRRPV